jgi:hypothetical protein
VVQSADRILAVLLVFHCIALILKENELAKLLSSSDHLVCVAVGRSVDRRIE